MCVRLRIRIAAVALLGTAAVLAPAGAPAQLTGAGVTTAAAGPAPARQRELVALLRQDCGACHGMRLTGGLGPPLTAEALYAKPADSMTETILSGRPGTAMPPWRHFMTESEAAWLVARLRNGTIDAPDSR